MPFLNFENGAATAGRLSARSAVDQGHRVVTRRVVQIIGALLAAASLLLLADQVILGLGLTWGAPIIAWIWWSYATPRWRAWALRRGVDPDELQRIAEAEKLVWPEGHIFERTEFRGRGE
jgi:hypothetical protein